MLPPYLQGVSDKCDLLRDKTIFPVDVGSGLTLGLFFGTILPMYWDIFGEDFGILGLDAIYLFILCSPSAGLTFKGRMLDISNAACTPQ